MPITAMTTDELLTKIDELQDRLALALDAARVGVWDWDITNDHLYWDSRMKQMFGVPDGLFGSNYDAFAKCVHPDDIGAVNETVKFCLANRVPYSYECRLAAAPDRKIIGRGMAYYKDGQPSRMIGVCIQVENRFPMDCPMGHTHKHICNDETCADRKVE